MPEFIRIKYGIYKYKGGIVIQLVLMTEFLHNDIGIYMYTFT